MEARSFAFLCLALLYACGVVSPQSGDMYDILDEVFTSGSASGVSPPPTPERAECSFVSPMNLIGNCSVPESMPTGAIDSLSEAINRGVCHSICLDQLSIGASEMQEFTGYPVWPLAYTAFFFSEDGRHGTNCLLRGNPHECQVPARCPSDLNPLLDCKRGCETFLRGTTSGCTGVCSSECQEQCLDPTIFLFTSSCAVELFPLPCLAECERDDCSTGCGRGSRYRDFPPSFDDLSLLNDNRAPHPTQPPAISHITNTLYRVSVEAALPEVTETLSRRAPLVTGLCTVVIKVEGDNCTERFYVLDNSNEVDLGVFSCQTVNISYAIATALAGVSNFSSPLTLEVVNDFGDFPGQFPSDAVQHTVMQDNRVGFFRQHIVNISWPLPENLHLVEGYRVSLMAGNLDACGQITVDIDDMSVTSYTFQLASPNRGTDIPVIPPVTQCTYLLTVEVLPLDLFGGEVAFSQEFSTGPYTLPSNEDLVLRCENITYDILTDTHNVTLSVELNEQSFMPAVIEAINYLDVDRYQANSRGEIQPQGNALLNRRLSHVNDTVVETELYDAIQPREAGVQYFRYDMSIRWKTDIPRQVTRTVFTSCLTRGLEFGIPIPVNADNINITSVSVVAVRVGEFQVSLDYEFTYVNPGNRGVETNFEVWLDETVAPENTGELAQTILRIDALLRDGTIVDSIQTSADSFVLYFQIRVVSELSESKWSRPLLRNITNALLRPEDIDDDQFDITGFTYSTASNGMGELSVTVRIELTHSITTDATLDLEACLSEEQLPTSYDSCPSDSRYSFKANISVSSNVETFSLTIELSGLAVPLYIQVRGVNPAELEGNWSNPEVLNIEDIPPPGNVIPTLLAVVPVMTDGAEYLVTMNVSWSPSPSPPPPSVRRRREATMRESEMAVTSYSVAVGFEPITEPYGDVPMSSTSQSVEGRASSQARISNVVLLEDPANVTNLTLYVQLRSISDGASGSWSEAIPIPVDFTTPTSSTEDFTTPTSSTEDFTTPTSSTKDFTTPTSSTEGPGSSLALVVGISVPIGLFAGLVLFMITALVILFCYKQYRLRRGFKPDTKTQAFDLWADSYSAVPYIPPGLVEGKEVVMDEWEIPTTDVLVENHLGEGAFGLVFRGTIRGPLRNPKLSPKLRQVIGLPVAIKLLKDTASNKEKSDFWVEIDMMKKISQGFCANVVNMVGCVTLQEPLCLITEFVPHGDLLDYLRNQRKKNASRKRDEKTLRVQLEQHKKAYEDMKRQVEMLQSAQPDPGEERLVTGGSGYTDFPDVNASKAPPTAPPTVPSPTNSSGIGDESPTDDEPLLQANTATPYADMNANGHVVHQPENAGDGETLGAGEERASGQTRNIVDPAPYLEPNNEYSHLDAPGPVAGGGEEEEEGDIYEDLGDLDGNDLMQFAYQIATGMEYLASINIVHRDLACRNILVGEGKNLKITDFGLSREVEDVYVKTTKGRLPLKWMALESIEAREFTTNSDVWSYGIVLWEIGTMGGFPYPTIQNQDLLTMLKQGYRLEKPDNCAPEVYQVMLECWQEHPFDRPNFSELHSKFGNLLLATTDDTYMELEVDEAKVYYTMAEEEEKAESISSEDSDSSVKKPKNKKIEKPKWAQNPYVPTPSTFKDDHLLLEDEHYRVRADVQDNSDEEKQADETAPTVEETEAEHQAPPSSSQHLTLAGTLSSPAAAQPSQQTAVLLEDQMGIPLSFITGEKPSQPQPHRSVQGKKSNPNPYIDDPFTKQVLVDEGPMERSKLGSLTAELGVRLTGIGAQEESVTPL